MLTETISKGPDSYSQYKERVSRLSNEFEIGLFFYLIKKSFLYILLFFITACVVAYLYLRYTPPVYESKTVLQINSENQASQILEVQNIYESQDDIARSIELLRSKIFFRKALTLLPLQITYFAEGTFKSTEHYKTNAYNAAVNVKKPGLYGTKIYIDFADELNGTIHYIINGKKSEYNFKSGDTLATPEMECFITISNFSEIKRQQSEIKENKFFFVVNDFDALTQEYYPRLQIRLLSDVAKTIEISFRDNTAPKTADIVSTMSSTFINYDIENKGKSASQIVAFLDEQLSVVYERLRSAETSILSLKKDIKLPDSKNFVDIGSARLNTLEDELVALELKINMLIKIEKNLSEKKDIDSYRLIALLALMETESALTGQVTTLQNSLKEREELLYEVTPTSEKIKSIDFQIDVQKKLLLESIRSVKDKLQNRKSNLDKKIKELESQYYSAPSEEVEYSRLQRIFDINEKFYNLLLEKKTEYSISQAGNVSAHEVLDKAVVPSSPVSPRKTLVMVSSILSFVLLSLVLVLTRYILYNEVSSVNDIVKITSASVSILGIVPKYKQDIPVSQLLVDKNPKSLIAEAFRSIRTNLQFISNVPGSKSVAITSTVSGEGKTLVAINLAGIIAYAGRKVIVIDLDMRKPKIHIGFGAENNKGMSTLLIGKDSLDECIHHSNFENLDFITAGPIPPNPSELIISEKMQEIIDALCHKYDFVVFDTPPVGLVTDGISIIQKVDYPIYIFRAEHSKRSFIYNLDHLYNDNNIKRISALLNGVDIDRKSYGYNYGYGYGYGYTQGYGYYDERTTKKKKGGSLFRKFNFKKKD